MDTGGKSSPAFERWRSEHKRSGPGAPGRGAEALFVPELPELKTEDGWAAPQAWKGAAEIPFVYLDGGVEDPQAPTRARLLTRRGVLFLRFECDDPDAAHLVYASTGRDSPNIWRDDCVELFLRPGEEATAEGPHFILNPLGSWYDSTGKEDVSWDPPARVRARILEKGWTAELAVPLRALAPAGPLSKIWRGNLSRTRQGRASACAEETGWRATGQLRTNVPGRFGYLYFEALEEGKPPLPAEDAHPSGPDPLKLVKGPSRLLDALRGKFGVPALLATATPRDPDLEAGLTDPAWQAAPEIHFRPLRKSAARQSLPATARVLRGADSFFIGVHCPESDTGALVAPVRKDGAGIWTDDGVELFLSPERKESLEYRHAIVNAAGSLYTGRGKKAGPPEGVLARVRVVEGAWTAVVKVPFAACGVRAGAAPALWGFNVVRNRAERPAAPAQCSAWSPPGAWSLHDPARFGCLWVSGTDIFPELGGREELEALARAGARVPEDEAPAPAGPVERFGWEVFTPAQGRELSLRTLCDRHLKTLLDGQFAARDEEWKAVRTWEDWLVWKMKARQEFLRTMGVIPKSNGPLNARLSLVCENEDLRVERLLFESRPNFYVSANVFVPKRRNGQRVPAVVRIVGHSTRGRFGALKFCEDLARRGYLALTLDALGQGERIYVNNGHGSRTPTTNHYASGAACTLTGSNLAGYMIHDIMRALDYLETREEVDMRRVVLTGESGGGTMTSYVAALDDRLCAAAPVSAVGTSRYGGGNYDSEQVLFDSIRGGFEAEGRCALMAPKPLIVIGEVGSDEGKAANEAAYARARKMYEFKHAGGKLENVATHAAHGWSPGHTQPFLEWLARTVPPNPDTPKSSGQKLDYTADDCRATRSGKVFYTRELPGRETAFSLNTKHISLRLACDEKVRTADQATARSRELAGALRELLVLPEPEFKARKVETKGTSKFEGFEAERLVLETDSGLFVPAVLLKAKAPAAAGRNGPAVVWLNERGKRHLAGGRWADLRRALEEGVTVLLPDLRGTGETSVDDDESFLGEETSLNGFSYRVGMPLIGMRVRDALCCAAYLRSRPDVDPARVGLVGDSLSACNPRTIRQPRLLIEYGLEELTQAESLGPAVALLAFALDEKLACCATRGALASYASVCRQAYFMHPFATFVPGILRLCDVGDVCAAAAPRPLLLAGSVNARNQILDETEHREAWGRTERVYKLANSGSQLELKSPGEGRDLVEFVVKKLAK